MLLLLTHGHLGILALISLLRAINSRIFETGSIRSLVTRQWLTTSFIISATSVVLSFWAWFRREFIFPWPGIVMWIALNVPELSLKSHKRPPFLESRAFTSQFIFKIKDDIEFLLFLWVRHILLNKNLLSEARRNFLWIKIKLKTQKWFLIKKRPVNFFEKTNSAKGDETLKLYDRVIIVLIKSLSLIILNCKIQKMLNTSLKNLNMALLSFIFYHYQRDNNMFYYLKLLSW